MSTLLSASRFGIIARNQMMRVLPLLARSDAHSAVVSKVPRAQSLCHIERLEHLGRLDTHHQFAGNAVAPAELVGPLGTHVAAAGPCRDVKNVLRVLADRGDALDLNK